MQYHILYRVLVYAPSSTLPGSSSVLFPKNLNVLGFLLDHTAIIMLIIAAINVVINVGSIIIPYAAIVGQIMLAIHIAIVEMLLVSMMYHILCFFGLGSVGFEPTFIIKK